VRIAVTGSSGLIGSALVDRLRADGHDVLRLVRRTPRTADEHRWDPQHRRIDPALLRGVDAVVNLAGTPIRPRPYTPGYKRELLGSRIDATTTVSEALAEAAAAGPDRPRVLLSASGVGFYGDTGDRTVDESAPPGTDFLAGVCARWEAATAPAEQAGLRVAHLRTGLVLGHDALMLRVLRPIFRAGLGGRLGSGKQYWPWISLTDEVEGIVHLLTHDVSGPVNMTAPNPATNAEFTRTLGAALRRPAFLVVPPAALWARFGREMTTEMLVAGQRVLPSRLQAGGFAFRHPELEPALRDLL
jgi:uncharacterized protein (TIGR01777 family)